MTGLVDTPAFNDQSEHFKQIATSIEQKHIRRHNKKPGVSRRDENRPSEGFTNISTVVVPLATELYLFRKMLNEQAQDYIFVTPTYSNMKTEEREEFDDDVREKLKQFEVFINQLGSRVNNCNGINSTERSHLLRVHESLRSYLKETVDFVELLKKEHLKRVQTKNRSLADQIKEVKKDGHNLKYLKGLHELVSDPSLNFSDKLADKLIELRAKHPCIQYIPPKTESEEPDYIMVEEGKETVADGWDGIDELEFEDAPKVKKELKVSPEQRLSPIFSQEAVRNRRRGHGFDPDQEIRDSYEKWRNDQGDQFAQNFQQQTAIIKAEFVSADRDDEIEKLEKQICEIQSLSSVFSEKIMDQERDIDVINDLALHTTENLVDGNEWIRKAIANSAQRRVIFLFCIVVLTFTLLFLDWYNP